MSPDPATSPLAAPAGRVLNDDPASEVIGRRVAAGLLDSVMCFVIAALIGTTFGRSFFPHYTVRTLPKHAPIAPSLTTVTVLLVTMLVYWGVCEAIWAQTPGKAVFNLRVVSSEGGLPKRSQIALRTVARLIDVLPMLYIFGFVVLLASGGRGQRLGDRIARTRVTVALATSRTTSPSEPTSGS